MFMHLRVLATFVVACCLFLIAQPMVLAQQLPGPGQVLISELRFRGPQGTTDEFIEIYNNTDQDITVQASDTTPGWAVAISNGQITGNIFIIPNGTRIPARGHFLGAGTGYSLSGYPSGPAPVPSPTPFLGTTPDAPFDIDIPDGSGVALFTTTSTIAQSAATRLDAFGFTGSPALFKEGAGFPIVPFTTTEHTFYRDLRAGTPKDTNDNAADFRLVRVAPDITGNLLGAPGPENLLSPVLNNNIAVAVLDPAVATGAPPNRERRPNVEPNADLGTILFRKTFTNNTGQAVTRLRFRVVNITTLGTPDSECGGSPCADVRALTSVDGEASVGGQVVTVRGVKLEEPPFQPAGGGLNSSFSADFITLQTPLQPGQSVNIEFKLGVMRAGPFRFFMVIEASAQPEIITVRSNNRLTKKRRVLDAETVKGRSRQ